MAATQNPKIRLLHIRDEIDGVQSAVVDVAFEQFSESYTLRRVTERALQIISEAARALPKELTARHPGAPWSAIIGIGNILRHEYQHIDDQRLWEILTVHLPQLRLVVLEMLVELGEK
jgi:uncharacterized protein with HEPN domain